jgi:hypothetical protein
VENPGSSGSPPSRWLVVRATHKFPAAYRDCNGYVLFGSEPKTGEGEQGDTHRPAGEQAMGFA